jgi:hypothetical protein
MWNVDSQVSDEHRTKSRAVMGLPKGHNTLRKHLHSMDLTSLSLCRSCEAEEQTSAHTL